MINFHLPSWLQQQIQQVLVSMRDARQGKTKG